jgi:hypothetical protein
MVRRLLRTVVALGLVGGALMGSSPVAQATDNAPCGSRWFNANVGLDVQYCPDWSPDGWIPVWASKGLAPQATVGSQTAAGSEQIVGYIYAPGNDWYHCEGRGEQRSIGSFWNTWWAWTMADNGRWGWVNEVYFQGGGNDEPDAALVRC